MAVVEGLHSIRKFNRDQGCWPLYRRWPLLRGDRYEGFHCILSSVQDASAKIGRGCRIGPSVVIGPNVTIEDGNMYNLLLWPCIYM